MVWANALVLGLGGVLLTMPVILHFLMQPKPKLHEFPALRFVKKRQMSNKSRMRLRHIVLLILRCLLILLMAAALAGPSVASREFGQWVTLGGIGISSLVVALALATVLVAADKKNNLLTGLLAALLIGHLIYMAWAGIKLMNSESTQLIGDSAAPVSAVILVDNSFRMDYQHENKSNLDRAQEMGNWLLQQFPADSQVCVLSTDNDIPFFSVDVGGAGNRIENLEIAYATLSIPDRIADALKLLDEAENERKEIYVISDLAAKSWESNRATLAERLKAEAGISIFVLDVGQEEISNFSISPLELTRESITETGTIGITAKVARIGNSSQRSLRFRLERPDKTRPVIRDQKVLTPGKFIERNKVVEPKSNGSTEVLFRFSEPLAQGIHHGVIEIVGEDALKHDNARYFTIDVRKPWDILVVHGDGVTPDNLTEAIIDEDGGSSYRSFVVSQNELPSRLDIYDAVIFLDPDAGILEATWTKLARFVESGHGLGFFLGANAADGAFGDKSFHGKTAQKLLTGRLDRQWRRPDANLFLSPDNLAHPIYKPFREWDTSVTWSDFPVFNHWGLVADDQWEQIPTRTILRYGNGKPAIIERQIGEGLVMVMTTPITEAAQIQGRKPWNSLFSGLPIPAWILVRQMTEYLVQNQNDRLNLSVGEIANQDAENPLYKKYFMHGTAHHIGLDVHDVGLYSRPLEEGMVLTCEPGIYIPEEGIGCRLENDYLITKDGNRNLTEAMPIEIDAIEAMMKH